MKEYRRLLQYGILYQTGTSNQNTSLSYLADHCKLKTIYSRYDQIIFKSFTLFSQKQKASKTLRTQLSSTVSLLNSVQSTLGDECNMILCYSIFLYISYLQANKTISCDCSQINQTNDGYWKTLYIFLTLFVMYYTGRFVIGVK